MNCLNVNIVFASHSSYYRLRWVVFIIMCILAHPQFFVKPSILLNFQNNAAKSLLTNWFDQKYIISIMLNLLITNGMQKPKSIKTVPACFQDRSVDTRLLIIRFNIKKCTLFIQWKEAHSACDVTLWWSPPFYRCLSR